MEPSYSKWPLYSSLWTKAITFEKLNNRDNLVTLNYAETLVPPRPRVEAAVIIINNKLEKSYLHSEGATVRCEQRPEHLKCYRSGTTWSSHSEVLVILLPGRTVTCTYHLESSNL